MEKCHKGISTFSPGGHSLDRIIRAILVEGLKNISIGITHMMQLCICVMKIVTCKEGHLMW